ncbi:MAG: hypothetical protein J6J10_08800 [Alistipes sp.]|nr:hypothetical protein [Alistipes sp.]MBP3602367.1 hypothetical protein [Alistipes sp.]
MNLEQLQQSWNKLSERLEREEVIRKQELRLVMENKVTSYRNQIRLNQILGWVVLLCAVGILFVQGIQSDPFGWIVIGTVVVMDVLLFAPMYSIIMRLAKFNSNIIEQEQMIIRFEKMFVRRSIVVGCFFACLFAYVIIEALVRHAVLTPSWWLWMILTIIASAILGGWRYMQERERIADIKQRITLLKQFEE